LMSRTRLGRDCRQTVTAMNCIAPGKSKRSDARRP
jgi:hypothetical protein